ncbi:hypothetical protein [Kushneria phyllosphaerae]|uniref:Uncharacterized protein n=1 Tax=Kushneria phyllosphaerae TaxID=2100822 RepID=A0A2R8CKN7_9GAMM|nr:hypothetical protein [Kushneria phyllosphaerae]SPJ33458.1 hypothetical protein KSP9073_01467 [Kushneria phyllosphaerae]
MHNDPRRYKTNRVHVNFDDYEFDLLEALARYNGLQMATMLREMVMREALESLGLRSMEEFDAISVAECRAVSQLH